MIFRSKYDVICILDIMLIISLSCGIVYDLRMCWFHNG